MALTDKQKEALVGKTMETQMHLNMESEGILHQRCDELKLNRIIRTPKKNGQWGEGVVTWEVDDVDEEFDTLEAAVEAMEKLGII